MKYIKYFVFSLCLFFDVIVNASVNNTYVNLNDFEYSNDNKDFLDGRSFGNADAVSKYGSHYNNSKAVREKYKFLRYKEEMEPYLREIGVPEEVLPNLCDVIPAGGYKAYCRDRKADKTLIPFGDIDEWARGVKWLISWNYIITYFPTEVRSMRELEEMKRT